VIATFRIPGSWEGEGFKILARILASPYCDRSVSMYEAAGRAVSSMGGA
jgi:succinyl-CoA synthetase beta subunit/citryl-CoA synthetase large subunit